MRKIQQFMSKRCGIDELNLLFLFLSVGCYFVYLFLPVEKKIFSCIVCVICLALCICRMFSQNLEWRKKENLVLLRFCETFVPEEREKKNEREQKRKKVEKRVQREKKKEAEIPRQEEKKREEKRENSELNPNYVYFNCPYCNQAIRIPKKQGKVRITCPTCKSKFIKET